MKSLSVRFESFLSKKKTRVYILPNKQGYFFLTSNFVLFNIGNIYGNNIVLLLSFLMISLAVVNMILTHLNIKNLSIRDLKFKSQFSHELLETKFVLENTSSRNIDDLNVSIHSPIKKNLGEVLNIDKNSNDLHALNRVFEKRGKYEASRILISSQSPSQLFNAWKYLPCDNEFYVYPRRKISRSNEDILRNIDKDEGSNREFYDEHLRYSPSLPSRNIDWKLYAKTEKLYWKKYSGSESDELLFDFNELKGDVEERLETLSSLVDSAYTRNITWTLKLKDKTIGPSKDNTHWKECLKELSCY